MNTTLSYTITEEIVTHPYLEEFTILRTRVELWIDSYAVPIATMWLAPDMPALNGATYVEWLEVLPIYRRLGVGTALIRWARWKYKDVLMSPATDAGEAFVGSLEPIGATQ